MPEYTRRKAIGTGALAITGLAGCFEGGGNGDGTNQYTAMLSHSDSTAYAQLQGFAEIINNELEGVKIKPQPVAGASQSPVKLANGECDIGLATHSDLSDLINDEGRFKDNPIELDPQQVMRWYAPTLFHITSREIQESRDIHTLDDLAGEVISPGPPGAGSRATYISHLEKYGIADDIEFASMERSEDPSALDNGDIASAQGIAFWSGFTSSTTQIRQVVDDIVSLKTPDEYVEMVEGTGSLNGAFHNPSDLGLDIGTPEGRDGEVFAIEINYSLIVDGTESPSEEEVYNILSTIVDNADQASEYHANAGEWSDIEKIGVFHPEVPIHPGAKRYFEEEGVL